MEVLEKKTLRYQCDCSREKIRKIIKDLGKTEINAMIEEEFDSIFKNNPGDLFVKALFDDIVKISYSRKVLFEGRKERQ